MSCSRQEKIVTNLNIYKMENQSFKPFKPATGEVPKAAPERIVYDFSSGSSRETQIITPELLSKSIRRETGLAGIRSIPVQYWTLYSVISNMLEARNINYKPGEIHIQANSSKAYLTDTDKDAGFTQKVAPIDRWRFDKVICLVQLPNIMAGSGEDASLGRNAAIGLTLNKEGIMVSFGMNVWACSNFNVMGGTMMRSYGTSGREGMPWDLMQHRLGIWMDNLNQIWAVQNEIMHNMLDYNLGGHNNVIDEIIGDLYTGAVKQAYFKGPEVPFNISELSEFTQTMIKERKDEEQIANLWDVYNWGTSIMKPGQFDIGEIANNSNLWADYLLEKFTIETPTFEILN